MEDVLLHTVELDDQPMVWAACGLCAAIALATAS